MARILQPSWPPAVRCRRDVPSPGSPGKRYDTDERRPSPSSSRPISKRCTSGSRTIRILPPQRRQSTRIRNDRLRACTRTSSKLSLTSSAVTSLRRGVLDSGIYGRSTGTDVAVGFPDYRGDAVQPAFRFFIDWAARFALADDQGTYFVLDEFARPWPPQDR